MIAIRRHRHVLWLDALFDRKTYDDDTRSYNELITAWSAIEAVFYKVGEINVQRRLDA